MSGLENRAPQQRGFLDRLLSRGHSEPETRDDLLVVLRDARDRKLLDEESMDTIERLLQVSELRVRDIMIPRSEMAVVERNDDVEEFLPLVIETAHSRFPVIDADRDKIVGILLAKDLLRHFADNDEFVIRDMLRPAVFIPESKRLNVLLAEFRANRNHMAIVVDEFGGAAGLVTIEDVLEQIVGDIEDEHDYDEDEGLILKRSEHEHTVKARLEIEEFNEYFGSNFEHDEFDTIGGLVINAFGRMPKSGDGVNISGFHFEVLNSDSRRVHLLRVTRSHLDGRRPAAPDD